jgi:hypothetical protein
MNTRTRRGDPVSPDPLESDENLGAWSIPVRVPVDDARLRRSWSVLRRARMMSAESDA